MKRIACGIIFSTVGFVANADVIHPSPDGRYQGKYEGYQKEFLVDFTGRGGEMPINPGVVGLGQNQDGDWLFYFQAPFAYVDNSYGFYQSPDWLKGNSGKRREHTLDQLIKSDMLGNSKPLGFYTRKGKLSLRVDYLDAIFDGSGSIASLQANLIEQTAGVRVASSLQYNLASLTEAQLNEYFNSGKKPGKGKGRGNPNRPPSMDHLDNPLFHSPPTDDYEDSESWIFHVGYEIVLDNDYFTAEQWWSQTPDDLHFELGDLHASPPKSDAYESPDYSLCLHDGSWGCGDPEADIVADVSAPNMKIMLLMGLFFGVGSYFMRRRVV